MQSNNAPQGLKMFFSALTLLFLSQSINAQKNVPFFGKINWINGYSKEITGENIGYYSAFPDYATTALLTRTTNGKKIIEWETAPVPKNAKGKYVYFSWVAGHSSGTSSGDRNFDLYVNDKKLLTFTTLPHNQRPNWKFVAPDSSALVFEQTKRDASNDAHGFNYLRLPLDKVKPGLPITIKVIGEAQNSNDWYMAFKFAFVEKADINPMPFLLKNGKQPIVLTALHFGKNATLHVQVNHKESLSFIEKDGVNSFDIPISAVKHKDRIYVSVSAGKKILVHKFVTLEPVVYRELDFIHNSHTDIGYSDVQPEIVKIHDKNIRDALHMIEKTKDYPDAAKFKWNVESLWSVENFLRQATPTQKQRFIADVKGGSIGLSGLYANILTGLSEPEETFHYTDYAEKLRKEFGFTINSAMISDVPGYAWTTVTAFAKGGIKYFSSGPNFLGESHPYLGDRIGSFLRTWGDKPVWWTSPSGKEKLLFWVAGKGYSSWHGTPIGGIFDKGPKKIAAYLNELTAEKYPYDMVQWRYNIVSDNGPIDTTISDFVKQWNEKYASPKIILNTTQQLFEKFEKKYGASIPVVKGDITPYWEDGAFSSAYEEGKNRINSLRLQQLSTLYSMFKPTAYNQDKFYQAWRNIIMFHEHTWGAYNSTTEPDLPFVTKQWHIKKQFMLDADSEINSLQKDLLGPLCNTQSKRIAVINTSSWSRSGPVMISADIHGNSVKSASGEIMPLQRLSDGTAVFIAHNVPPLGTSIFEVTDEQPPSSKGENFVVTDSSLSNGTIWIRWDKVNGSITTLKDTTGFNYAGQFRKQGLNSYWYVPGYNPADAETNGKVQIKILEHGPVLTTIAISSEAPGANSLERKISLYTGSGEVEIENIIDKKAIRTKEAVHFGFPFNSSLINTTVDAGYGTMAYLGNQLPGSNRDFLYARRWLDASTVNNGVQLILLQAPLLEPDSMIDERLLINQSLKKWRTSAKPTATWFSYVMNNYWYTNYKADQDGVAHFRYALRPHRMINSSKMERNAEAFTDPLMAITVKKEEVLPSAMFRLTSNRIVVTNITPDGDGNYLVRLYNPEPTAEKTAFIWESIKPLNIVAVDTKAKSPNDKNIVVQGMGVVDIKLKMH